MASISIGNALTNRYLVKCNRWLLLVTFCVIRIKMSSLGSDFGGTGHRHNEKQENVRYRLTPEELRVLRECSKESFYYRSVPFSVTAMIATHYAVKLGYLRGSPKWGSLLKVFGFGVVGYFAGKVSYHSKCEEKIMQLTNGPLAESLRRRKQGLTAFPDLYNAMDSSFVATDSEGEMATDRNRSGIGPQGTWEIDTDRNIESKGLDDSNRPSLDNPMKSSEYDAQNKAQTTYEALRKQNRDEYEARRLNFYGRKEQQRPNTDQKLPPTRSESVPVYSGIRNEYGDIVEK